ncbi:TetR/AcrR family transcriptional regulator [Nocardia sp. NPDC050406]|uniref:TetR/AcrR family transcriptional regulator n=1 Tax=Nocardia sp. NPDC050406 TaxID=3364318 RepID=UPI0037991359
MGNREDLMAGARKAILDRGLAKVTARDIATAAGVSLAAIGYHFGSKDRLITEALTEATGSGIGDAFEAVLREAGEGRTLRESLTYTWNGLLDAIAGHREQLLLSMENAVRIARSEESQQFMAEATEQAHGDIATTLREVHPELTRDEAEAVAKLYFATMQGMALLWLVAPSGDMIDGGEFELAVEAMTRK